MRFYFIAGEASGDLHASKAIRALKKLDPNSTFRAWGGDLMQKEGATLVKHYRELAFMGFSEVIANLGTILRNIQFCKEDILANRPDALVLVDYPGFNLRIAEWAKKQGIKVFYYISPQLWAWKKGRIKIIRQYVDKLFVILPFETTFYQKEGVEVTYVGHPLLDAINEQQWDDQFRKHYQLTDQPLLALLPGSRKQEINTMLPIMLQTAKEFKQYQILIAGAPSQPDNIYQQWMKDDNIKLIRNDTYNLLKNSHLAIVTSGTATLETALIGVPEVVVYKGSRISYEIGKRLVNIRFISLVNLILDRASVKELIQNDCNPKMLKDAIIDLEKPEKRKQLAADFEELKQKLGNAGASQKLAEALLKELKDH